MPSKKEIVYEYLKKAIAFNEYPDGRIPNERDLAVQLEVSQGTLRQALDRLEKEGLIERIRSQGTFVKGITENGGKRTFLCIMYSMQEVENPFVYVRTGMELEAKQHGYDIVTLDFGQVADMKPAKFNQLFQAKDFAGILLCIDSCLIHPDSPWSESPLPVVVAYSHSNQVLPDKLGVISINGKEAWRMAVQHLLDRGHRRIGCLTRTTLRGMSFAEYARMLKVNGADPSPELIVYANYDKLEITRAVDKLLDLREPPTALICFSDFFAIYASDAVKRRHRDIPGDLAIIGNCGYPGAEFFEVPLSTVSYNYNECGVNAVRLLLEANKWFGKAQPAPRISVPSVLLERASTALQLAELKR